MVETAIAAVVGHPVAHSLSPEIFSILSKRAKRPVVYRRIDLGPEELSRFFISVRDKSLFTGWNVTLPHKEALVPLMDTLTSEAKAVGAVNVVQFSNHGTKGFNTDVFGVRATFKENQLKLRGKTVVLFGAGGAAKAVAYALGLEGAKEVCVTNRTLDRASEFVRYFSALFPKTRFRASEWEVPVEGPVSCVINATPLGLKAFQGQFAFPKSFEPDALAFDLLYRPAMTPFLKFSRGFGLRTVNGMDMLLWQAIATWEIWFGELAHADRIKKQLKKKLLLKG
jgi:shikimate dehydrogenase